MLYLCIFKKKEAEEDEQTYCVYLLPNIYTHTKTHTNHKRKKQIKNTDKIYIQNLHYIIYMNMVL